VGDVQADARPAPPKENGAGPFSMLTSNCRGLH
jgi:hypothetical protein